MIEQANVPTGVTRKQLALGVVLALVLGFAGAVAGQMYMHHAAQHAAAEQLERDFKTFQQQVAQAINQLAQQAQGKPPGQ